MKEKRKKKDKERKEERERGGRKSLKQIPFLITISDNEQAHIRQFALQNHQHRTTVRGE